MQVLLATCVDQRETPACRCGHLVTAPAPDRAWLLCWGHRHRGTFEPRRGDVLQLGEHAHDSQASGGGWRRNADGLACQAPSDSGPLRTCSTTGTVFDKLGAAVPGATSL